MLRKLLGYPITYLCRQAQNLKKIVTGDPLTYPSLGSATLDRDDVEIARKWLRNRSRWAEQDLVHEYENKFADWNGSRFAYAFMSGREALSACIAALGLTSGDEVILPGYTCIVVANAFHFAGVKIVYSDIELQTYGLEVRQLEEKITTQTKAILIHHLYGLVCHDYEAIIDLARKYHLKVIEDCAHSTGAEYMGRKVGNYGDVAFYSSEQSKVFNSVTGGIAITNTPDLAEKLKESYLSAPLPDQKRIECQLSTVIRNFYIYKHPLRWLIADIFKLLYKSRHLISTSLEELSGVKPIDYGQRMPAPIAALCLNQLNKIDRYNEKRRAACGRWDEWCEHNHYEKPLVIPNSTPVFLRYPVMVEVAKKKDVSWASLQLKVELGVWFSGNLHPVSSPIVGCPNADEAVKRCINFPTIFDHENN